MPLRFSSTFLAMRDQELLIGVGLLETLDEHVESALGRVDTMEDPAHAPDEGCLIAIEEQLLLARAAT